MAVTECMYIHVHVRGLDRADLLELNEDLNIEFWSLCGRGGLMLGKDRWRLQSACTYMYMYVG